VKLVDSSASYLSLQSSVLSGSSYTISSLSPSPPSITIQYPQSDVPYSSSIPVNITVSGQEVVNVSVYVDGSLVKSFSAPGTYSFNLSATSYPDGTHTLSVIAVQSDGVSSEASVQFETTHQLQALAQQTASQISLLNSSIVSVKDTLSTQITEYFVTTIVLAILGIILAIYAIMRKSKA